MTDLAFGVFYSLEHPESRELILKKGFDFFVQAAEIAEKLNFKVVCHPDHFMLYKNNTFFDAWTLLTALSPKTKTIRLASLVTPVPFYQPAFLAKRVASLDVISGGRVVFGAGCGWYEKEFRGYGVPYDSFSVRIRKMNEGIELMKALWTREEPVDFAGKYYRLDGAELEPKPLQKPHPPIWFGGTSRQILEAVALHGQGWMPWEISPETYRTKLALLHELLRKENRDPSEVTTGVAFRTVISSESREVKRLMELESLKREFIHPVVGDKRTLICGTPDECRSQLQDYVEAGAKRFIFGVKPISKLGEAIALLSTI